MGCWRDFNTAVKNWGACSCDSRPVGLCVHSDTLSVKFKRLERRVDSRGSLAILSDEGRIEGGHIEEPKAWRSSDSEWGKTGSLEKSRVKGEKQYVMG
jgi:hypothetical protein